ncbi:Mortality factor 4-like protein 1 [Papilio xuthus]|uniref:Mortality factor 4-like protein 1 n=1 Tax=Papilio xuthus TaxID=66420 RepID=A0A194QCG8_PAPXU|nr:Mortality factor 4-like protein 1 [Papilio xuthus]
MAPKLKFAEGEKVLCFHGPLIYEAKCLKSSVTKDKHVRYLIHYAGWNKNWDEWVPESRVLKYNEANVQRQKEVQRAHSVQPVKSKKSTAKGRKSETAANTTPAREESRASTPAGKDTETTPAPAKATKTQSKDTAVDSGSDQPKVCEHLKWQGISRGRRRDGDCVTWRLRKPEVSGHLGLGLQIHNYSIDSD